MSAHTPGPWIMEEGDACTHIVGENALIAEVRDWPARRDESEANARLIAAAPRMLGTLKQVLTWAQNGKNAQHPQCRADQRSNADRLALIEGEVLATLRVVEGESNG